MATLVERQTLTFEETVTIDEFLERTNSNSIRVVTNPHTGGLFVTFGQKYEKTGAVSSKGIPQKNPVMSLVTKDNGEQMWLLHEMPENTQVVAEFK